MTSLAAELGRDVTVDEALPLVEKRLDEVGLAGTVSAAAAAPAPR